MLLKDVRFMLDFGLGIYWKFTWCLFIPVGLSVIFVYAMVSYKPITTDDGLPIAVGATGKPYSTPES
jgi:solute carrier family 6 amino acid transporter-like protein 5/7/9/14